MKVTMRKKCRKPCCSALIKTYFVFAEYKPVTSMANLTEPLGNFNTEKSIFL